jgi:hypothetical protein
LNGTVCYSIDVLTRRDLEFSAIARLITPYGIIIVPQLRHVVFGTILDPSISQKAEVFHNMLSLDGTNNAFDKTIHSPVPCLL